MSATYLSLEQKDELWNRAKNELGGISQLCNTCGGSSTAFCQCAYQEFLEDPTSLYNTLATQDENFSIDRNEIREDIFIIENFSNNTNEIYPDVLEKIQENKSDSNCNLL